MTNNALMELADRLSRQANKTVESPAPHLTGGMKFYVYELELRELLTEAATQLRTAASGVSDPGAEARDAWPARFGCNGPQGSFWTDDSALANKLIASTYDRDDWTVTDTQQDAVAGAAGD